jgi:putative oxidoreductase
MRSFAVKFTYFLLRAVSGFLIFQAGAMNILGWFGGGLEGQAPPAMMSQAWIGGVLQLVGGIAILLGLFTQPAAFLLSGEMAVAYWQFHAPHGPWPGKNDGLPAALFCFIFFYIAAQGGGSWSLDALLRRKGGNAKNAAVHV